MPASTEVFFPAERNKRSQPLKQRMKTTPENPPPPKPQNSEVHDEKGVGSDATYSAPLSDAIAIARGCLDYGGGYRSQEAALAAFHHGIQTVVNALTAAKKAADTEVNDTQVNALRRMGNSQQNAQGDSQIPAKKL